MAVFPTVPGAPDYSSSSSSAFIPEIWSGTLVEKFYEQCFLPEISNSRYEGEIKNQGDTVKIRTMPDVAISKYKKGQKLVYEFPTSASLDLVIDQGLSYAVAIDNIDKYQSDLDLLGEWAKSATQGTKIAIERECLADLPADADATNCGNTAGKISGGYALGAVGSPLQLVSDAPDAGQTNILDAILMAASCLDENDIPESDRFILIPAWAAFMLKRSDLKSVNITGDPTSPLRNGKVGNIDRFILYISNLLPYAVDGGKNCFYFIFGHKNALTFASQYVLTEHLEKMESTFGQAIRGLNVYGKKVVDPKCLGYFYGYNATND